MKSEKVISSELVTLFDVFQRFCWYEYERFRRCDDVFHRISISALILRYGRSKFPTRFSTYFETSKAKKITPIFDLTKTQFPKATCENKISAPRHLVIASYSFSRNYLFIAYSVLYRIFQICNKNPCTFVQRLHLVFSRV